MPKRSGRKSAAQTPAPKSERIYGSSKNPKGSASSEKTAKNINLNSRIIKSLEEKLKKFKEENNNDNITMADLKAVYRRGLGAYSSSHRPTITGGVPNTRNAWAMARVNKFLKKASGEQVKKAYVQDDDLMEDGGIIISARITEMPKDFGDEMPKVYGTFEDGTEQFLFDYYPDEISFTEKEIIGLTPEEARHLKFLKDKNYLMYSNTSAEFKRGGQFNDKELLAKYKEGKNIGFTATAHLKAKGLIPRTDVTKKKSEKYKYEGGGSINQDITCVNCGWEWNTKDSDESDKYVCHKCNFDNTLFYTVFKDTLTPEQIAEKHGVELSYILNQLEEGKKHETEEHTKGGTQISEEIGETIALHHLEEMPDYYERIKLIEPQNDEIVKFLDSNTGQSSDIEYVRYSLWYIEPGEVYDFYDLVDAVQHTKGKEHNAEIRDYDGRRIMSNQDIQKVLTGEKKLLEYENGGMTESEPKNEYEIDEFLKEQKEEADAILFSRRSKIAKFMICNAYIEMSNEKIENAETAIQKQIWQEVQNIWENTKDEVDDVIYMYEEGGSTGGCGCTKKYSLKKYGKGGLAYGNSHDKGGMPMVVKSTGQNIEIEGGEGVINKRSMQMTKKVEFEGKQVTPCEVISKINQMGGGVKFNCDDVKEIVAEDGFFD
jgi:hypothetical protein